MKGFTRKDLERIQKAKQKRGTLTVNSAKPKRPIRHVEMNTVQVPVVAYIRKVILPQYHYARLIVNPGTAAKNAHEGAQIKRRGLEPSQPDIMIVSSRTISGQCPQPNISSISFCEQAYFADICLEIKAKGKGAYRKDGNLKSIKRLKDQADWMFAMAEFNNYFCAFTEGYEETIKYLNWYFDIDL